MRNAPTAEEKMLPFPMAALSVDNPALVPWRRAASERSRDLSATLKVYHHLTPRAKGVVYLFHGGEGSAEQWVAGEEEAALVADLVRCRYSVVALESTHRPIENNWFFPDPERFDPAVFEAALTPGWNATINADELLLRAVHAQLGFNSGTRVYLAGFSSGAKFACAMAYNLRFDPPSMADYYYATPRVNTAGGLNVCAAAFYNNAVVPYYLGNYVVSPKDPASAQKARQYSTPSIFNYSELDAKNPVSEVEANASSLEALAVAVPFEMHLAHPIRLEPDRFARVLGISFAESRGLYAALRAEPASVDPQGCVLDGVENSATVLALDGAREQGVRQQLAVLRALHHVSAAHHHHTVAFFDRHIGEVR
jgi:hypothetical protein